MPIRFNQGLASAVLYLLLSGTAAHAGNMSDRLLLGDFSALPAGEGFGPWRETELPSVAPARFSVVGDDGTTVVSVRADAAASTLAREIDWDVTGQPYLQWRWKIDRVVSAGDIASKDGDDFAARLYVMFDYPVEKLPFVDRAKLKVARWLYGDQVPAAALCYVWGNAEAVETEAWSAYTDRVRLIVLRNRDNDVGDWVLEQRNVAEDYRRAFGGEPMPAVGLAIAADTDQTGESVQAWFGDIHAGR